MNDLVPVRQLQKLRNALIEGNTMNNLKACNLRKIRTCRVNIRVWIVSNEPSH